jgi:hypothetical protein
MSANSTVVSEPGATRLHSMTLMPSNGPGMSPPILRLRRPTASRDPIVAKNWPRRPDGKPIPPEWAAATRGHTANPGRGTVFWLREAGFVAPSPCFSSALGARLQRIVRTSS